MEDFHEINDDAYLDEIRTGKVTFIEIRCTKIPLTMFGAYGLAQAINATNKATAFEIVRVKTQEQGSLATVLKALSQCPDLKCLYLGIVGKNVVTEEDVDVLCRCISNSSALTLLDMSYVKLSPAQQLKIIEACGRSKSLENIMLSEWSLSSDAINALGRVLETSRTLKSLELQSNGIKSNELGRLLHCLSNNNDNVLEELYLGCNSLGESGLAVLSPYVRSSQNKLRKLDLGCTGLNDNCADLLADIINANTLIEWLSYGSNQLSLDVLRKIAEAVRKNDHLTYCDLHGNEFLGRQRLAAIPNMSLVPETSLQLLKEIELRLAANKSNILSSSSNPIAQKYLGND